MAEPLTKRPRGALPAMRIRAVSPHATYLHEHLARLSDEDRRVRLGRQVAAVAVEAYCTRSRCADPLILGCFIEGRMIASAELFELPDDRFGLGHGAAIADLLIAVEKPYRRHGVAQALGQSTIRHAAARRIALVRMAYLENNLPMQRLTASLGAVHNRSGSMVRAELCTGWLRDSLVHTLIERAPGFRPISSY